MTTFDTLAKFLEMFPQFHEQICQYAPNGLNSITVWFKNNQVLDFTYISDNQWRLINHKKHAYPTYDIGNLWRY